MGLIELIGIGSLAFVLVRFAREWREWLRLPPPRESVHIAGEDDRDIDFAAAIRSIGGPR